LPQKHFSTTVQEGDCSSHFNVPNYQV